MPTYEYACKSCGRSFEVVQGMKDAALTTCEECGGQLRKVFFPAGIMFKGSGFYATDNRKGTKGSSTKAGEGAGSSSSSGEGGSASGSKEKSGADSSSSSSSSEGSSEGKSKGKGDSKGDSASSGKGDAKPAKSGSGSKKESTS